MKKLATIFLALMMIIATVIPAFAAENTTLTIENSAGRSYSGYQLLNLSTSLKAGDTCADDAHTDDCYTFAYSTNAKYADILKAEVFANDENPLWTSADDVTDEQILEYLAEQSSGDGTLRQVANRLYRAIKDAGITADEATLSEGDNNIAQGYWLFADVSDLSGNNEANSLVIVDTKGQDSLTISPKTALPTVEKKVKDIADSTDDSITDNNWQDAADHDMGDVVPFKLTATLPANVDSYNAYTVIFHDTLSAGLTLDAASIKVLMYNSKDAADADVSLAAPAKDVTANFTSKTSDLGDTCSFEVSCADVLAIDGVTKDTAFVVYYEATLNNSAVLGSAGNPNTVYLEYSNDPYGTNTGKTETDKVTVFTYQLTINKVDPDNNPLAGAGFTLYKKNAEGLYEQVGAVQGGADSALTTFNWIGLDDGDYKLVESTVPAGYNGMSDLLFTISAEHSTIAADPALTSLDGGALGTGAIDTGLITKDIVNNTGTVLPETGATGTLWLIFGGSMLVFLAAVFMITRKKMSVYED